MTAAPTGSPSAATVTTTAGSEPSAHVSEPCPMSCGTSASSTMNAYASPGCPATEPPVTVSAISSEQAPTLFTIAAYVAFESFARARRPARK